VKALVLCAGLGTRLRPLTETWPKPAVPLLGQPLLRYTLAALRRAGVDQLAINTHHLPAMMEATARAEAARAGCTLEVSYEPVIQGTAGGIRGLKRFLTDDVFVVWNGDILFAVNLEQEIAAHRASGAAATMVLMPMPRGETYAAVEMDPAGRIARIAGRGPGAPRTAPWHFTGVHLLSPAVFDFMSPTGEEDINRAVYPRMLEKGLWVRGAVVQAYWSDLGTPARYLGAQQDVLNGQVPLAAFPQASPFEGAAQRASAWVAPGARVDAAQVAGQSFFDRDARVDPTARVGASVYVGVGARVGAGARVNRAAVFENTELGVGEELVDAIAWGERRLPI